MRGPFSQDVNYRRSHERRHRREECCGGQVGAGTCAHRWRLMQAPSLLVAVSWPWWHEKDCHPLKRGSGFSLASLSFLLLTSALLPVHLTQAKPPYPGLGQAAPLPETFPGSCPRQCSPFSQALICTPHFFILSKFFSVLYIFLSHLSRPWYSMVIKTVALDLGWLWVWIPAF